MTYFIGGWFWGRIRGVDGKVRRKLKAKNAVTTLALTNIQNVFWKQAAQASAFYSGLIKGGSTFTDGLSDDDTIASHAGWQEFTTYDESTRQLWTPGTVSSGLISNPTRMKVTISSGGGGIIKGAFMVTESTKGGTTGLLVAHGLWDTDEDETVVEGESFEWGYKSQAASG